MRRTDKSNVFVIMERADYLQKLDDIQSNTHKFSVVTRNPIAQLQTEVNKVIRSANKRSGKTILKILIVEFKPRLRLPKKTHKSDTR